MTKAPQHDELAAEIEAAIEAYHDAMPQGQGEQGDPFAAKEAAKVMARLLYNHSDAILTALRRPPAQNSGDAGDDTPDALAREPLPCHLCGEPMVRDDQQWRHGPQQEGCFLALQYLDDDDDIAHWNAVREPLRPSPTRDAVADGEGVKTVPDQIERVMSSKWLDPECGEGGCQSLRWKRLYEQAVKGRQEFRRAYREALRTANTGRDEVLEKQGPQQLDYAGEKLPVGQPRDPQPDEAPVTTVADEPYHMDAEEHAIMHEALSKSVDIRSRPLADDRGREPPTTDEGETR